jgi:hypothetical protein
MLDMRIKLTTEIKLHPLLGKTFKIISAVLILFLIWLVIDVIAYLFLSTFLH